MEPELETGPQHRRRELGKDLAGGGTGGQAGAARQVLDHRAHAKKRKKGKVVVIP